MRLIHYEMLYSSFHLVGSFRLLVSHITECVVLQGLSFEIHLQYSDIIQSLTNTALQHPVALCRSEFMFHFCRLCGK
jgi:hypothetical protein